MREEEDDHHHIVGQQRDKSHVSIARPALHPLALSLPQPLLTTTSSPLRCLYRWGSHFILFYPALWRRRQSHSFVVSCPSVRTKIRPWSRSISRSSSRGSSSLSRSVHPSQHCNAPNTVQALGPPTISFSSTSPPAPAPLTLSCVCPSICLWLHLCLF